MNKKNVVILAPVMPLWDDGQFCAPLVSLLASQGFNVSIIDTLSLIPSDNPQQAVEAVQQELVSRAHSPFLLVGFAMAGTLVQLLSKQLDCLTGVISISAPGYADPLLKERIGYLVSMLDNGHIDSAIEALHQFVVPEGHTAPVGTLRIPDSLQQTAIDRMKTGFSLLLQLDARPAMAKYHGKYLGIVGEKSQLATWDNQTHSRHHAHIYACIPEAGMRPWNDNGSTINQVIKEWVEGL